MIQAFDQCPVCGGELKRKRVEKLLRGGNDTAVVEADADVCLHCGERLYAPETIRHFEQIREMLSRNETGSFRPLGRTYQA
jgi:YgiT-type zinc finger domain-containing protein